MLKCDNCEKGRVVYKDANESECISCGKTYPNAHLKDLESDEGTGKVDKALERMREM